MKLNVETLRRFDLSPLTVQRRENVKAARLNAQRIREQVDAYVEPYFQTFDFLADEKDGGKRIERARDLYLSTDEERVAEFFAGCDRLHAEHGFEMKPGYCPALVAENLVLTMERQFLEYAAQELGVDFSDAYGDTRERALSLLVDRQIAA